MRVEFKELEGVYVLFEAMQAVIAMQFQNRRANQLALVVTLSILASQCLGIDHLVWKTHRPSPRTSTRMKLIVGFQIAQLLQVLQLR